VIVVQENREQADIVARRLGLLVEVVANFLGRLLDRVGGAAVELDEFERIDLLRLVILGDIEVRRLQIGDRIPVLVRDDDVDANVVDAGSEDRGLLAGVRGLLRGRRQSSASTTLSPSAGRPERLPVPTRFRSTTTE